MPTDVTYPPNQPRMVLTKLHKYNDFKTIDGGDYIYGDYKKVHGEREKQFSANIYGQWGSL